MTDLNEKIELTSYARMYSYGEEMEKDISFYYGRVLLRKSEIEGIQEDTQGFFDNCFNCCIVYLKSGAQIDVKESYAELSEAFKTFC